MKILNRICASTDPGGTLLITGFHLDIEPLTLILWTWPFSQFLNHLTVHPSNLHLSNSEVRMFWGDYIKGLTEVQVYNIHRFSTVH